MLSSTNLWAIMDRIGNEIGRTQSGVVCPCLLIFTIIVEGLHTNPHCFNLTSVLYTIKSANGLTFDTPSGIKPLDLHSSICRNWATEDTLDGAPLCVMLPVMDMANHEAGSPSMLLDSDGASLLVHGGDGIAEGQAVLPSPQPNRHISSTGPGRNIISDYE